MANIIMAPGGLSSTATYTNPFGVQDALALAKVLGIKTPAEREQEGQKTEAAKFLTKTLGLGAEYESGMKGMIENPVALQGLVTLLSRKDTPKQEKYIDIAPGIQQNVVTGKKSTYLPSTQMAGGKILPQNTINNLTDFENQIERMRTLSQNFQENIGGHYLMGGTATTLKELTGSDPSFVNWWKDYKELDAIRRHEIFGATLTGNEKKGWDAITVNERSSPKQIKEAVQNRLRIMTTAFNRKINRLGKSGYNVEGYQPLEETISEGFAKTQSTSPKPQGKRWIIGSAGKPILKE